MAIFETVLKSDLKKPVQVKQLSGYLFSGDNQGNKISVEVMDNGSPATLTGGVTGYVIREDNATVTISGGTLSGNKASIVLPEEAYNVVGRVSIVVKVGTVTVGACTSYVYKTSTDTLVDPTGAIPSLQELLAKISACEQATADANKIANLTVSAETATGSTPDAVLSETGSPAHKHITFKLVKGDKGDKGDTGETPQLSIGTVTTLQPSQEATVTITGTDEEPVLNFGIPQGESGNETIDDTAGLGDTDLVYSADKVVKLFKEEHEHLTSGSALQLLGQYTDENVPYVFRKTPVNSKRVREKLVGGTVAWNQVSDPIDSSNKWNAYGGTFSKADGVASFTEVVVYANAQNYINMVVNHKYLISCDAKVTNSSDNFSFLAGNNSTYASKGVMVNISNVNDTNWHKYEKIGAFTDADSVNNIVAFKCNYSTSNIQFKNVNVFDLTAMFGSTVADAIYAMEQATAGAGVAWFRSLFPKDYYEYNPGELISVSGLQSHDTVGFNQWDEEWEVGGYWSNGSERADENQARAKNYIPVLSNTTYATNKGIAFILYFDSNKNLISVEAENTSTKQFITPSNCRYVKFSVSKVLLPVCINISDLTKNGTYEPYQKRTYPLDSSLTLRGIPKLDSNNRLYYDGDEYESSGKVTRKYGIVDMGTFEYSADGDGFITTTSPTNIKNSGVGNNGVKENILISNGLTNMFYYYNNAGAKVTDKSVAVVNSANGIIFVRDDSTLGGKTTAQVKTAMSGVYLVYELATPTTETADPYQEVQICDGNGTEEFVDGGNRDVAVPVGHESKYSADIWQIIADLQAAILAMQS